MVAKQSRVRVRVNPQILDILGVGFTKVDNLSSVIDILVWLDLL